MIVKRHARLWTIILRRAWRAKIIATKSKSIDFSGTKEAKRPPNNDSSEGNLILCSLLLFKAAPPRNPKSHISPRVKTLRRLHQLINHHAHHRLSIHDGASSSRSPVFLAKSLQRWQQRCFLLRGQRWHRSQPLHDTALALYPDLQQHTYGKQFFSKSKFQCPFSR